MRPWLNLYSYVSSKRLMDDVLCVLFYPDDSVRLEMTWFVQAVSVKMMNFVDGGRESDDNIRTSILIACVCPCLISSRLICFCFTQGLVWFSAHTQIDVTKRIFQGHSHRILKMQSMLILLKGYYGYFKMFTVYSTLLAWDQLPWTIFWLSDLHWIS